MCDSVKKSVHSVSTGISASMSDKSWMYTDRLVQKPGYDKEIDYEKKFNLFSQLNSNLEAMLKDFVLVNCFMDDEYKGATKKIKCDLSENLLKDILSSDSFEETKVKPTKKRSQYNVKNFVCTSEECDKEYCSIDALALHVKRKHPGDYTMFGLNRKKIKKSVQDKLHRNDYSTNYSLNKRSDFEENQTTIPHYCDSSIENQSKQCSEEGDAYLMQEVESNSIDLGNYPDIFEQIQQSC